MSQARAIAFILLGNLSLHSLTAQTDDQQPSQGREIATVLGKPVYESDLNKNVSAKDNLIRLVLNPLIVDYCQKHGITRDEELTATIKNAAQRAAVRPFVLRAELNRHLYEKYGGRVLLDAFGPIAFDGMKKWIQGQQDSGNLHINAPDLKAALEAMHDASDDLLFASPSQIKQAFDPSITTRFIQRMANPDRMAPKTTATKTPSPTGSDPIGVVRGKTIHLTHTQRNGPNLPEFLRDLIVPPLEEAFLQKHPEIAPSETELSNLSKHLTSNGEEATKSLNRSLQEIERKLEAAVKGTDEYGELRHSRQVVKWKLKRVVDEGRRAKALVIATPAKLQQYLYDRYGGGRAIRRGAQIYAFDAQKKWIDELQQEGVFSITDPQLRATFHEYWTNEDVHASSLHDAQKARAWFNPPWIEPSIAAAK